LEATLKFKGYCVEHLSYKRNSKFWVEYASDQEPVTIDMQPRFTFEVALSSETHLKANVLIGAEVGEDDGSETMTPFRASALIRGYFYITNDDYPREKAIRFYSQNAIAILYPYLRSIISDITGKGDHQPIILPTLNIIKIAEEYEQKEGSLNDNDEIYEDLVK
jgi:preprotein translocase subunit SecB